MRWFELIGNSSRFQRATSILALFGSVGTLFCCALPALFVTLGLGATLAGLVGTFPQLVWLSEHKKPLFIITGLLLGVGFWLRWWTRGLACPTDPAEAAACQSLRKSSGWVQGIAVVLYAIGIFFAFIAPRLFGE